MNEWCRRGRKKNSILVAALISTVTERCWHLCISLLQHRGRARNTCTRVRRSGWGTSAEIISAFCQKAKRRIGYLRKGISPRCKLWIKQQNILGCHTLEPLTFLYLTVEKRKKKTLFPFILSPCLCNYHVPILPCPHSHPQYPEGLAVFLLVQQLPPLSLWNKKFGVGY